MLDFQVGGIKEKLLAARAAGLSRALVPARNMRDVQLEAAEATAPEEEDDVGDGLADAVTTHIDRHVADLVATEQQQQQRQRRMKKQPGLAVIPVATLEDVLAAAFDPPYLLKKRSKL